MDLIQIQSNTACIYVIVYRSCDTLNINYHGIIPKITELIINYKWYKIDTLSEQRVMLNYDLAALYEVETKYLNLAVKRNLKRFPYDFMFYLTKVDWENLRLQIATLYESLWLQNESLKPKRGGSRYLPYAFTEQGLAMLSEILNSEKTIESFFNTYRIKIPEFRFAASARGGRSILKVPSFLRMQETLNINTQKERTKIGFKK